MGVGQMIEVNNQSLIIVETRKRKISLTLKEVCRHLSILLFDYRGRGDSTTIARNAARSSGTEGIRKDSSRPSLRD